MLNNKTEKKVIDVLNLYIWNNPVIANDERKKITINNTIEL